MDPDCFPHRQPTPTHADASLSEFDPVVGASGRQRSALPAAGLRGSAAEDFDSYRLIEPPPLDWRSDSSSEAGSAPDLEDPSHPPSADPLRLTGVGDSESPPLIGGDMLSPNQSYQQVLLGNAAEPDQPLEVKVADGEENTHEMLRDAEAEDPNRTSGDEDHSRIQALLTQLQTMDKEAVDDGRSCPPAQEVCSRSALTTSTESTGLLFSESHQRDLLGLLQCTEISATPQPSRLPHLGGVDAVLSVSYSQEESPPRRWRQSANGQRHRGDSVSSLPDDEYPEPVWMKVGEAPPPEEEEEEEEETGADGEQSADDHPSYKDVPGPCDPEDLLDGVIFGAKYLGSTQIKSDRNPSTNARMTQAQEAVDRIKAPEGESQPMTEVDLFISTKRIKVLTADTQEAMMDHSLQTISYIADIGDIVVLMARRKPKGQDADAASQASSQPQKKCLMICHVFSSEDAQVIAQAIGQAFGVAYQQFLQTSGIKASDLKPGDYSNYLESQELYNGDLAHFSDSQNLRDIAITKAAGEILGLAVVESGWGSILPTVVVANLLHGGPAERCGELSIGDRVMSVNGTSLVGLPITTCQNILRDLKSQKYVKLSIVHCPPVTMAIIKRPDVKCQLGFSVDDGIICSLMRGGIAERGGIRVGHRIIEINEQSVVATPHDKIIQILTNAVGEIHLKTMPASTYRLLTGQEQPLFL
ncbi:amyloid-beta A4 precursor protein-binding family A member 3 [Fundulus heteroclitus]|uniref:amyloid-beta A4 precursor protein-binding family A member 3 n=1 Tax=Fundulus heteroclitus TaxID=8078 RepID=UPI00165BEF9B|nr:amyloid-beta A4 precursor protein-binding family A member 3 [Fundulus heteroclitus]